MDERLIAIVEKNITEEYRIKMTTFHGYRFIDLRVYAARDAAGERRPTKKGVAIRPNKLGTIIAALQQAEAIAREEGLIGDKTAPAPADDVDTPHGESILAAG